MKKEMVNKGKAIAKWFMYQAFYTFTWREKHMYKIDTGQNKCMYQHNKQLHQDYPNF